MIPRIEPVTSIGDRFFDRRQEDKGRKPRERPEDTFDKALREAQEVRDGRPNDSRA